MIKTSNNSFAKFIRASLYPIIASLLPIIIAFKILTAVISGVIDVFKGLVEWVKNSNSMFAKFLRFDVNALVFAFQLLGKALSVVGDMFSKIWGYIKKFTKSALGPIIDLINLFSGEAQKELGVNVNKTTEVLNPDATTEVLNPDATAEKIRTERIEKTNNDKIEMNINNNTGFDADVQQSGSIPIILTSTM